MGDISKIYNNHSKFISSLNKSWNFLNYNQQPALDTILISLKYYKIEFKEKKIQSLVRKSFEITPYVTYTDLDGSEKDIHLRITLSVLDNGNMRMKLYNDTRNDIADQLYTSLQIAGNYNEITTNGVKGIYNEEQNLWVTLSKNYYSLITNDSIPVGHIAFTFYDCEQISTIKQKNKIKTLEETTKELFLQPWNLVQYKIQPIFYGVLRNSKSHGFLYKNTIQDGFIKFDNFELQIPIIYKDLQDEIKKTILTVYLYNENNQVTQHIFFERNDNLIKSVVAYFNTNKSYACEKLTDTYFVFHDDIKKIVIQLDIREFTESMYIGYTTLTPYQIREIKSREA